MGLSIAIFGGIISVVLVVLMGIIFSVSYQFNTVSLANTDAFEIENSLQKSKMNIKTIQAQSGNDLLNFTLSNIGSVKFWNYEDFDVFITYDADIGGIKTKTVEIFTFDKTSSFLGTVEGIAFDASNSDTGRGATATVPLTVGAGGADRFLFVGVSYNAARTITNVDWDGIQTMTSLGALNDPNDVTTVEMFELVAPNTGAHNVKVFFDGGGDDWVVGASSWTEVNQITATDPAVFANGDSAAPTITVASKAGDRVLDTVSIDAQIPTADPSQTQRWSALQGIVGGGGSDEAGAASVPMDWTVTSTSWAIGAVNVNGFGAGGTCDTNAFFDTNDWIIGSITNDILDPRLINTGEVAQICTKLSHPIFANGNVQINISTDLGHTASKSVTVT